MDPARYDGSHIEPPYSIADDLRQAPMEADLDLSEDLGAAHRVAGDLRCIIAIYRDRLQRNGIDVRIDLELITGDPASLGLNWAA